MEAASNELNEALARLDTPTRTLFAEVDLGEQAKEFIQSDLGRHLTGCLRQEIILATELLVRVHPWRWRRVRELQNRIWRAEYLLHWLKDLIITGQSAKGTLEEAEHE